LSCYRRVADDRTVLDRAASVVGFYFVDASATCKQAILRGSGPTWVETLISLADRARKAAAMSEQKFEDQVQRCSWRRAAPIKKSNHRVARRPSGFTVAGELANGGQPHQRKSTGSRKDPLARRLPIGRDKGGFQ